ncbi:hypothetical protein [Bradyrhizobium sp.]|uniref:hypothetical protein n=1 Tax=Bradyrhizobium sp. TaxID=376 RepID=UPI0026302B24|nr:hypothetical protein [Bradyrhizobium sp.]
MRPALRFEGAPAEASRFGDGRGTKLLIKDSTIRVIIRWIHIICAIPIIGYIYSPFQVLPDYAPPTRFVFFPVMLLSGLWMWKGHLVRRVFSKRLA